MEWKQDKTKHAIVSFLLVLLFWIPTNSMIFAMVSSLTIGIFKEIYDEFFAGPGSHWDPEDIVADAIGILAGGVICSLI
jgi:hypothetical protein